LSGVTLCISDEGFAERKSGKALHVVLLSFIVELCDLVNDVSIFTLSIFLTHFRIFWLTARFSRLGSIAPNFQAETTNGPIDFHEFIGDKWVVLFSHPEDYTPVCTTELGAFAKLEPEFTKRGAKLIGLSANTIESHGGWIKDIDEISGSKLTFPIIGDKLRQVAYSYDMLDHQDTTNVDAKGIAFTIRSVFIIDPKKTIRLILSYPASTGRNTAEVLRVLDSCKYLFQSHDISPFKSNGLVSVLRKLTSPEPIVQTGDKNRVTTPINWVPGDDVIVHPSVKNEEAKTLFPDFRIVKPYLRFTPLPKEKTSAA
jgi:alkyl hydroperoxide reductase subunit AhpC